MIFDLALSGVRAAPPSTVPCSSVSGTARMRIPAAALQPRRACGRRDPIADTPYVERGWGAPRGALPEPPRATSLACPGGALSSLHTQAAAVSRIQACAPQQRGLAALSKGVTLVDGAAACTRTPRSKRTGGDGPARGVWSAWLSGRAAGMNSAGRRLGLSRRRHPVGARVPCGREGSGRICEAVYVCAASALVVSTRQAAQPLSLSALWGGRLRQGCF